MSDQLESEGHDPLLRNRSPRAVVGSRFIGPLEAVIWIATRDMEAIRGAMGYVAGGEDRSLPPSPAAFALVVLGGILPRDVAGHHHDCVVLVGSTCNCDELGRLRYCRCQHRDRSQPYSCSCVEDAKASLLEALHGGMPIYGRASLGDKPINLHKTDPAALIDMHYHSDGSGLRLIPNYFEEILSWTDIYARWPAGFPEKPIDMTVIAAPVPGEIESGRPSTKKHEALTIFVRRMRNRKTKWPAIQESRQIAAESANADNVESIAGWMRPYYRRLFQNKHFDESAVATISAMIEADLEDARQRRVIPR